MKKILAYNCIDLLLFAWDYPFITMIFNQKGLALKANFLPNIVSETIYKKKLNFQSLELRE